MSRTFRRLRRLAVGAIAVSALVMASACTPSSPTSQPSASGGGPVTINWWTWNPDETTAQPFITAFESEHPNIKINHRFLQYSDYVSATQLALTSGSGPDVFGLQVGALTTQLAPLSADLTPYLAKSLGDDWQTKLTATDQLAVDGKQVGAPWMITGGGLIWANQTLVDSLGLTVPTTAAELKDFCVKVEAKGKQCLAQGAKDSWQNIDVYQAIMNQVAPGEFYKAVKGESSFDTPQFVQGLDIWKGLFDDKIFPKGALGVAAYPDANDAFHKGKAALITFGTWQNGDTTKTRLDQYVKTYGKSITSTVFMPYAFPAMVDGAKSGTLFGGPDVGFAVADGSKNKDAAAEFAVWLSTGETSQKMMAKTVQQPALKSVPLDLSDVVNDTQKKALEAQGPALSGMIGARQIPSADVQTAVGDALSEVASGQETSAKAAAKVEAAIKSATQ